MKEKTQEEEKSELNIIRCIIRGICNFVKIVIVCVLVSFFYSGAKTGAINDLSDGLIISILLFLLVVYITETIDW